MIDITVPLRADMPVWPGTTGLILEEVKRLAAGDSSNQSKFSAGVHVGTHVDAPRHFVAGGATIDELSLRTLVGPAVVADLLDVKLITAEDLAGLRLPLGTERLLLRTTNSYLWAKGEAGFHKDFVALAPDAARWLVDRGVRLVGIDYLSVQRYNDSPRTHQILLEAGIVIVEGLSLVAVSAGEYELICLPLCLVGAEGAPARAVLRSLPARKPGSGANSSGSGRVGSW